MRRSFDEPMESSPSAGWESVYRLMEVSVSAESSAETEDDDDG